MIGVVATLKIKEGSGADFEAVASQLVEKVNANEDGVVYYDLYKEDDTTYVFLENELSGNAQFDARRLVLYLRIGSGLSDSSFSIFKKKKIISWQQSILCLTKNFFYFYHQEKF